MKIFGYNNFSTVRTPFNGTIDAIDRPSQEYRELRCQFIQEVDTGATANCSSPCDTVYAALVFVYR